MKLTLILHDKTVIGQQAIDELVKVSMRKFSDTFVLVVSSFVGVLLYVKGNTAFFVIALFMQYAAFISYATRIRETSIKASPYIFNFGYIVVLLAYLLSCYLFKRLIL